MSKSLLNRPFQVYLLIWFLSIIPAGAMEGNPFLTHFRLPAGVSNHILAFEQGENGLMYVLNRKGIFNFDGFNWENLGVSGRPIAMAFSNRLFYSTDKGVGYFLPNETGTYDQLMIIEPEATGVVYSFIHTGQGLIAVAPQTIYHLTGTEVPVIDTLFHNGLYEIFISDFFIMSGNNYIINNYTDICLLKPGNEYEFIERPPEGEDIVFSFIHAGKALFGSSANKLYSFDGTSLSVFQLKQAAYLGASIMNGGLSLNDDLFALSTLNGGCLIIDASDGSTVSTLNVFNGLPDDEVYSLGIDNEGGLWISHGMGITRADISVPVRAFEFYPGLQGNLLSCIFYNGTLYAGCSEGLYYLAEERDYRTIVVPVPRRQERTRPETGPEARIAQPGTPEPPDETIEDDEGEEDEQRRGLFSRLITRITQGRKEEIPDRQPEEIPAETTEENDIPPSRRVIHQLQSVSHRYKPVQGVRGKVSNLTIHEGSLFAATNLGLFLVTGETATSLVRGMNIVFIEGSRFHDNLLLIGSDVGAFLISGSGVLWSVTPVLEDRNQIFSGMLEIDDNRLLVTTEFDLYLLTKDENGYYESQIIPVPGTEFSIPKVRLVNGEIRVFTASGVFRFDEETESIAYDNTLLLQEGSSPESYQEDITWFKSGPQWYYFTSYGEGPVPVNLLGLLDNINYLFLAEEDTSIYAVTGYKHLYRVRQASPDDFDRNIGVFLKRVVSEISGDFLNPENIKLIYANNALRIDISAPFYIRERSVMFQYNIEGLTNRWSDWSAEPVLEFPYFPPGSYIIKIRARDIIGNTSETLSIPFQVRPPFWQTAWFYLICLAFLIFLIILIIKTREQKLKKDKAVLELKVKERTATIEDQKKILQRQHDDLENFNREIIRQKEKIELQRDQIFYQNEETTKSINYAKRIQSAVMPSKKFIDDLLKSYFIIFRPRDIVSGDFYWITRSNGKLVVVASDCTGHGVPGALMSMMGVSFLNDIVIAGGITRPDIILNDLRNKIKSTLSEKGREYETTDGMDIAVCVLDERKNLQFAGAFNPLYLIRDKKILEFEPDKMPVGAFIHDKKSFTLHDIKLVKGDRFYMFSDGFVDQFGGPRGKKFKTGPLRRLLLGTSEKPIEEQRIEIEKTLDQWQAGHDQVDDILLIGIEIV